MDTYQKELEINRSPMFSIDGLQELKAYLVKIQIGRDNGSGFFYLIKDDDLEIPVLVTNNHIINLDHFNFIIYR